MDVAEHSKAWNEGWAAAVRGLHFKTDCPYTFDKFPGISQEDFNKQKRPLMNEWFKGWQKHRDGNTRRQPAPASP